MLRQARSGNRVPPSGAGAPALLGSTRLTCDHRQDDSSSHKHGEQAGLQQGAREGGWRGQQGRGALRDRPPAQRADPVLSRQCIGAKALWATCRWSIACKLEALSQAAKYTKCWRGPTCQAGVPLPPPPPPFVTGELLFGEALPAPGPCAAPQSVSLLAALGDRPGDGASDSSSTAARAAPPAGTASCDIAGCAACSGALDAALSRIAGRSVWGGVATLSRR